METQKQSEEGEVPLTLKPEILCKGNHGVQAVGPKHLFVSVPMAT
jgi:hypothetical protein